MTMHIRVFTAGTITEHGRVDGVYFFNGDTHGSADALTERAEFPDDKKVVFVNTMSTDSVVVTKDD